jgi:sugar lactone lactonase YvrE
MGRARSAETGRWRWRRVGAARWRVGFLALVAGLSSLLWAATAVGTQPFETYEGAVAADGPVAQFRLSDVVGSSTIADSVGSYTASNSGITLGGEGPFGGSESGAFGGEAFATLPSGPLAGASAFTAEAWVDWAGGTKYKQPIFDFGSSSTNYMYLTPASSLTKHTMLFEIHTSTGTVAQVTAPTLKSKAWEYVAVTETSGGTLTLYLNGEQVGQTTALTVSPASLGSTTDDYLGKSAVSGEPMFDGSMSNVAFYSTALSPARILAHYNAGEFPVNTVLPTISGTAKDGKTLTARAGTWSGLTPITFAYQWTLCNPAGAACGNIPSANEAKYTLGHEDVGDTLRVAVTATNSAGLGTATSAQTGTVEAIKPSDTALPVISGSAAVGQLLSVSNGSWAGSPPSEYTYQWESCTSTGTKCKAISGATASSYEVLSSQVGDTLRAIVTAVNSAGSASATSEATPVVTTGPPRNKTLPAISGTARDGQTLSASTGSWAGTEPFSYTYQWELCNGSGETCSNIAGATGSSYLLGPSDVGETLRVRVTATNSVGSASATSQASAPVAAIPPANTAAPTISGAARDGQTLTASTGSWNGSPPLGYAYQWERCNASGESCANVSGATASTYLLGHADVGSTLRVAVTASNPGGAASSTSAASAVVAALAPSNTAAPAISGTAEDGQRLTASTGEWAGTPPLTYSYQWQSCNSAGEGCSNVPGATGSSYLLGHSDVGTTLRVIVTASNSAASVPATSAASAVVTELAPSSTTPPSISGEAVQGQTLTASSGEWAGTPPLVYAYQWQSCNSLGEGCLDIPGATNASYTLGAGEVGMTVRVGVTATNTAGSASSSSPASAIVSVGGEQQLAYTAQFGTEGSGDGQFGEPADVAVDANGHLWVLDRGNDRVQEFSEAGEYLSQFGSTGSGNGQMRDPDGLAVSPAGDVWVLDTGNQRLEEFSEDGAFIRTAGSGVIGSAEGIAVDRHGNVWVSATYGAKLDVFNSEGTHVKTVGSGGSGSGQLDEPEGLTVDSNGDVWVAEWANDRVQEFSEAGEYLSGFGTAGSSPGEMTSPYGITAGGGHVFVGEAGNHRVQEFTEAGTFVEQIGTQGSEPGQLQLKYPLGLAINSAGDLWVTDSGNNRIEEWSAAAPAAPSDVSPPSISGEAFEGQTLSATTGDWKGTMPLTYTYQWQSCNEAGGGCTDIASATGQSYTLEAGDVGRTVRVLLTATNALGSASAISQQTAVITPPQAPANTSPPNVSGEPYEGQTLAATVGSWSGTSPLTYTYRWQRCNTSGAACADIEGASEPEYTLGAEDVGSTLRVLVTAANAVGSASSSSEATAVVSVLEAPANTEPPTISGESAEGQMLTASTGSWTGTQPMSYSYQWEICEASGEGCKAIRYATSASYELGATELGELPRVVVTATNLAGSTDSFSEYAGVVQPAGVSLLTPPSITGKTEEGEMLTASEGEWSGTRPLEITYQWEDCDALGESCVPIAGATGLKYALGPADIGGTVRVIAKASNAQGGAEAVSGPSGVVTAGSVYYVSQLGTAPGPGQLQGPGGVASAPNGDFWVVDGDDDRVVEFDQAGEYVTAFGSRGEGEGQLEEPTAVAVNSSGDVWVVDSGNDRVEEFSETGEYLQSIGHKGSGAGQFELPWGIAVSEAGDVWVSDPNDERIEEFTEAGEYVKSIEGGVEQPLREPRGLATDASGDVWVADPARGEVDEYSQEGALLLQFSPGSGGSTDGGASSPLGIALDADGNVWITDFYSDHVKEFTDRGEYLAQFGSEGSGVGEFEFSRYRVDDLAIDPEGDIWVTDHVRNRVEQWKISPTAPSDTLAPSISGEASAGVTLAADDGEWAGAPVRYRYQWQLCNATGTECADISGATASSYTLTNEDAGATLRVLVTAYNGGGSASAQSAPTAVVAAAIAPSSVVAPAISGSAQDGQTLHAGTGTWGGTPASSYSYQWQSCNSTGGECASIEAATSPEYALGDGDVGTTLRVLVTATNDAGSVQASSPASTVVLPEPAGELEAPAVSGVPDSDQVLYAGHGAWAGTERQFSYQWESCDAGGGECAPIEGATGQEYDLGEGDLATTVRVRIGMNSASGSLTDVSAATPVIGAPGALANTAAPSITGGPQVGQTLTSSTGSWSLTGPLGYSYQWQRCDGYGQGCADIEGATAATYTPAAGDGGHALRVLVSASGEGSSRSQLSSATQPVAASAAPVIERPPLISGAALQGQTLTASTGQWSSPGSIGYSYQWERCASPGECAPIAGASSSSYTLTEADVESALVVQVTATSTGGSSIGASVPTAKVAAESLTEFAPPSISGAVELGGELAADPGIWSGAGSVSFAYDWESCDSGCTPIEGAGTSVYQLADANLGETVRVDVTASNSLGSRSAQSAATLATPGGEVSVEQAEEAAQQTDPAVLAPSTTATLDAQTVAPALSDEERLTAQQSLTSSAISKETPGEFAVNTADGELSLTPQETSPHASPMPTLVNGVAALLANTAPATDTIIRPDALGATTLLQLRSDEAPRSFSWKIGIGPGQQLRQLTNGSIAVTDVAEANSTATPSGEPPSSKSGPVPPESSAEKAERESEQAEPETEEPIEPLPPAPTSSTSPAGAPPGDLEPQNTQAQYESATSAMAAAEAATASKTLMVIEAPQVSDAGGHLVPASLTVLGNTVTLHLQPSETTTYPVLAELSVAASSDAVSEERDPFAYGLSDEEAATFSNASAMRLTGPDAPLYVQTARLIVPWDVLSNAAQETREHTRLEQWLPAVEAHGLEPYITFKASGYHGTPDLPEYRKAIKEVIEAYKGKVHIWGAWNEPDLKPNRIGAKEAGQYWQAAESVILETECKCTVVAGEFAEFPALESFSATKYEKSLRSYDAAAWATPEGTKLHDNPKGPKLQKAHQLPEVWGLHDYADVVHMSKEHISKFLEFAGPKYKLGTPQVWISEAGVELYNNAEAERSLVRKGDEEYEFLQQTKAAEGFLALRHTKAPRERISRVQRVYYYSFRAPDEAKAEKEPDSFDSGLFEAMPENASKPKSHNEPRPAYCYLAYPSHRCPPSVVIGNGAYMVNPFGNATTVEFSVTVENGSGGGTQTKRLVEGLIHPVLVAPGIKNLNSCKPTVYHYTGVAKNVFGEATDGPEFSAQFGYTCIGS